MLYVLAPNDVVDTFPYRVVDLKADNPNTSFPSNPSDALLAEWDVFPVTEAAKPSYDDDQTVDRNSTPVLINGAWIVGWTVRDLTQAEINDRLCQHRTRLHGKLTVKIYGIFPTKLVFLLLLHGLLSHKEKAPWQYFSSYQI